MCRASPALTRFTGTPVPHGQKLALGGQSASPRIRPMRHRQRIEIVPWHSLQRLMKNAMVMAHGIDPRYRV
jgi:hypothetical protein